MHTDYENRGYLRDSFRLFHLMDAQGTRVEAHYHEFYKVLLLLSGSGGYMVEGRRYRLKPGDAVLVGRRCIHRPEFENAGDCQRIIIYISPEFLRERSGADCGLESVFQGDGHVLRPEESPRRRIFSLAAALERELSGGDYGAGVLAGALLTQLLVELGRARQSRATELPRPAVTENSRVQDIIAYLEAHLAEDITVDALAERFFISKYHMMRLFRRETGQSIHSYLSDRRLLHARDLMAAGVSATESCFRSGFRSYSSFTRAYGRRFGATPTGRNIRREETWEP